MANNYLNLRGQESVLRSLDEIQDIVSDGKLVVVFGNGIRDRIVTRTQQGIDANGRKFKAYSAAYGQLKGRRSPVTLSGTATRRGIGPVTMMGLVEAKKTSNTTGQIRIRSGGKSDRRIVGDAHHYGKGRNPERKWMGLSPADRRDLSNVIVDWIDDQLRGRVPSAGAMTVRGTVVKRRGSIIVGDNP